MPSAYSKPIHTRSMTDTRELRFEAFAKVNSNSQLQNLGNFSKCTVIIDYQYRKYYSYSIIQLID